MSPGRPRIVVADRYLGSLDHEAGLAGDRAEVVGASLDTPADVAAATAEAAAVLITIHPMSEEHIAALGNGVRVIGRAGIGLDNIDLEAARRRGIAVYHTPDYCVDEVADQTLACILMLQRRMADQQRVARAPGWPDRASLRLHALTVTTVGVVGGGRIGRAVLARLAPFGVRRLVYDPFPVEVPAGVEATATLEELLTAADIVTLHLPLLPETRGLLSEARIRSMRAGSFLVNVSRGPLVDTRALAAALRDGHLAGAAIDVYDPEPPTADDPLLDAPNTILTPHHAWHSIEAETRCRAQTLEAVLAVIDGREPPDGRLAVRP